MSTQTQLNLLPRSRFTRGRVLKTPSFARLRPDRQPPDPRRPFPHQRESWAKLSAHLNESRATGVFEGLLIMPTGAGKTFTTAAWSMKEIINHGGRVFWLAHRDELLEHAADSFHRAVGLARRRRRVAVRIVSGAHCAASQINSDDDIVIASVASLARHPDIVTQMLNDPRIFTVIDEGHHSVAPSYELILRELRARPSRRLLGLTATPTRTLARERPRLNELFGNRILYEADVDELIERGILARPVLVRVDTHVNVDRDLTPSELAALEHGGDFNPAFLNRVARMERRNQAIVDHYVKYRGRYGKTLIFASTVDQAVLLAGRLRKAGVGADYVAAGRRNGRDNRAVLRRFRDPGDGLDVLVSVDLLIEGVDLPTVQTSVLARPTSSSIRAHQMAGRALRGPAVGGTAVAYLVALVDDWQRLPGCRDPFDLMPDLVERAVAPVPWGRGQPSAWTPPPEAVEAIASEVGALIPAQPTDSYESVTVCWYVLGDPVGGRACPAPIAVYSHQRRGWEAAIDHLEGLTAEALAAVDAATVISGFFEECEEPRPSTRALERLLEHFRSGCGRPVSYTPEDRLACDPRSLARQIFEEDLGERARTKLLEERYTPLARAIYPTPRDYRATVDDALCALHHADEAAWAVPSCPVYEP